MDKISSILPASPRVKSIDVSRAQPVRPGAPTYGRPVGKNSLGDAQELMAIQDKLNLSQDFDPKSQLRVETPLTDKVYDRSAAKKSSESAKLAAANDIAAKFFMENPKSVARENDLTNTEQAVENMTENFKAGNLKSDFPLVKPQTRSEARAESRSESRALPMTSARQETLADVEVE